MVDARLKLHLRRLERICLVKYQSLSGVLVLWQHTAPNSMSRKKMPPAYGLPSVCCVRLHSVCTGYDSPGPVIVAVHKYRLSSFLGPAEQLWGGSLCISLSSFAILFVAELPGFAAFDMLSLLILYYNFYLCRYSWSKAKLNRSLPQSNSVAEASSREFPILESMANRKICCMKSRH